MFFQKAGRDGPNPDGRARGAAISLRSAVGLTGREGGGGGQDHRTPPRGVDEILFGAMHVDSYERGGMLSRHVRYT